jgi:hypothetical protein
LPELFDDVTAGTSDEAFARVADDVAWWIPGTLPFSGTTTKFEYMQIVARIQGGFPSGFALLPGEATAEGHASPQGADLRIAKALLFVSREVATSAGFPCAAYRPSAVNVNAIA